MKRAPWRVGWSKDRRRFYFRAPSGYSMTLSGRKAGIADHARDLLPKMLAVAEKATDEDGNPEFIAAIKAALSELGVPSSEEAEDERVHRDAMDLAAARYKDARDEVSDMVEFFGDN